MPTGRRKGTFSDPGQSGLKRVDRRNTLERHVEFVRSWNRKVLRTAIQTDDIDPVQRGGAKGKTVCEGRPLSFLTLGVLDN